MGGVDRVKHSLRTKVKRNFTAKAKKIFLRGVRSGGRKKRPEIRPCGWACGYVSRLLLGGAMKDTAWILSMAEIGRVILA